MNSAIDTADYTLRGFIRRKALSLLTYGSRQRSRCLAGLDSVAFG